MFRYIACVLLLLVASVFDAQASTEPCTRAEVTVLPFTYTVSHDLTLAEISAVQRDGQAFNFQIEQQIGLGMVKAQRAIRVSVAEVDGCRTYRVAAGFLPAVLYVGKGLRAQSVCAYNHVMRHEMEHISIYTKFVSNVKPRLDQAVLQAAGLTSSQDERVAADAVYEAVNDILKEVKALHEKLDSPEEYEYNTKVCRGEIPMLILTL